MDSERQTIIERVQKLLALADDKGATDGEIAAAAAAAKRLLSAYQLSLADVQDVGDGGDAGAALEEKELPCGGQVATWRQILASAVARVFEVLVFRRNNGVWKKAAYAVVFIGRAEDLAVALYFYNYMERALQARAAEARRGMGIPANEAKQFNTDFIIAAAEEIERRLTALYTPTPAETALAVRKKDALEKWKEKLNVAKARDNGTAVVRNEAAYLAGKKCGRQIALNRGLPVREPALFEA